MCAQLLHVWISNCISRLKRCSSSWRLGKTILKGEKSFSAPFYVIFWWKLPTEKFKVNGKFLTFHDFFVDEISRKISIRSSFDLLDVMEKFLQIRKKNKYLLLIFPCFPFEIRKITGGKSWKVCFEFFHDKKWRNLNRIFRVNHRLNEIISFTTWKCWREIFYESTNRQQFRSPWKRLKSWKFLCGKFLVENWKFATKTFHST